ncbi:hypothetical protein ACJX0J_006473, partial [Zea mays]
KDFGICSFFPWQLFRQTSNASINHLPEIACVLSYLYISTTSTEPQALGIAHGLSLHNITTGDADHQLHYTHIIIFSPLASMAITSKRGDCN